MKIANVRQVQRIAREVIKLADKAIDAEKLSFEDMNQNFILLGQDPLSGSPTRLTGSIESGALRRRSLDLTRALAEMRRP